MAQKKTPSKKPKTDNTDPNEDRDEDQETEDEDQEEDNSAEENRRINAIVTSRVKREMKPIMSALTQMQETMKSLAQPKKPENEDDDDDETDRTETDKKAAVAVDPKLNKKLTKLERELADERAARKAAEDKQVEEAAKSKRAEMRSIYDSALSEAGVTDPKLRRAALNVLEEDGVMVRDEDGKIKFRGVDKYGLETNFDPKTGLKAWVAGDGKSFVPAVDAGGSGTGGSSTRNGGTGVGLTAREVSKMNPQQRASINLERACSGLPPLPENEG